MRMLFFLTLLSSIATYASNDWDRYALIAERAPFGKEPLPSDEPVEPRPTASFGKMYRLCMLYKNSDGDLRAGVISKTSNKNYFLQIGEHEDDLKLVDVRLDEGIAVLQKGMETAELLLEGLSSPVGAGFSTGSASESNSAIVRHAPSSMSEKPKNYSFLQPVRKRPSGNRSLHKHAGQNESIGGDDVVGGAASDLDKPSIGASGGRGVLGGRVAGGPSEPEQTFKRIIVTSSAKKPGRFDFIPR